MAVLAAILPIVSRSSALAVHLYSLAAVEADTTKDLLKTAKYINNVSLIVKQLGTIIKEDDRLPSSDAFEILEDILSQCTAILSEIENIFPYGQRDHNQARRSGLNSSTAARLQYLLAHLDALRSTLAVMLQTLYTAQSIMWTRVRPTVSLAQCATAVANEKQQLETLIIEQQMSILRASKLYEPSGFDTRLLMEQDSAQSLVALETDAPQPSNLFKYQDKFIASLDIHNSDEAQWLLTVCSVSKSQLERLLDRWTRLRQFEESLREEERKAQAQKRESQQPFVESDSEDDICSPPRSMGNDVRLATSTSHRPGSTQIHMSETVTLPIPVKKSHGPHAPSSPASSYGATASLGNNPPIPVGPAAAAPVTPRSSITTLPVEAAAAIEAKDKDDEIDLEIPWTLCTRRHYWKYIDGTVQSSNTDAKPSEAFSDRNSWTEILASWVCKEAIQEEGYKFTQVQKERRDGRRTRFETCFCIEYVSCVQATT
ncbi:hypothetical protein CC80DRAFT_134106 [Byssothecium circinans]|uniref:Fungal N-terminal domain-containing protein n=1 Tax=Byssothecium circinans TaxID=147558 RepID=A0A6A5TPR4_9PLEO|nr:hypothetical protein CC80DRAFT_134106 [Byssothecium circinans]